jgi:heat shock 70kDa protein 1/2/6/8
VAYGAAVQAAILTNVYCSHIQSIQLFDVLPLSLGISSGFDDHMETIITKQSKIPCKNTQSRMTVSENQSSMRFDVFEGERKLAADNNLLGTFTLQNITKAPRGVTKAMLTFDLNADGILEITAQEQGKSNNLQQIKIDRNNSSLKKSDVDRMLADAIKYKEIDEKHAQRIAAVQNFNDLILKYERALADSEHFADLNNEEKSKLKKRCSDEFEWLRKNVGADAEIIAARLRDFKIYFESLGV